MKFTKTMAAFLALFLTRSCLPIPARAYTSVNSAPFDGSVEYDIFRDVTATCYYPKNNPTWTADVMQNYDGDLTWYSFGTPDVLPGDINGDSSVDPIDAYRIMLHYSERTELDDIQLAAADVNGDGRVDTADAYLVILCHNGQISTFSAVN